MRGRLFFLPQPLFEEADGYITHGTAILCGFGLHLTVKFIGYLKSRFHVASLLYYWAKINDE